MKSKNEVDDKVCIMQFFKPYLHMQLHELLEIDAEGDQERSYK